MLRSFLAEADARGISVEYLDGEALWLSQDQHVDHPKQVCSDVIAFNEATTDRAARFDGIHFDIEPHILRDKGEEYFGPGEGWWDPTLDPDGDGNAEGDYNWEWEQRWQDLLNDCRAKVDTYNANHVHHMTLSIDVGHDYHEYYNDPPNPDPSIPDPGGIVYFTNRADGPIDYVTVMNYYDGRKDPDGNYVFFVGDQDEPGGPIVGGVDNNLAVFTEIPVLFGMETCDGCSDPDRTLWNDGYTTMYDITNELVARYENTRAQGVAIHHYYLTLISI